MTKQLTRRELYDLIWAEPLRTLAKRLDISDRGLAKKCDAHNIPRPPQGHWVRLEFGHEVEKTPLPTNDDPMLEVVEFYPSTPKPPEAEAANCFLSEKQTAIAVDYRIPERVSRYDDSIRTCRDVYKAKKWLDKYGRIEFRRDTANPGFKVTPATFDRASRFMQGLINLCQKIGWQYTKSSRWRGGEETYGFSHSGEVLLIQIKEPVKQIKNERDPKDSLSKYWRYEYEYRATNNLELTIENLSYSGLKHRWADKGDVLIETKLFEIIQSMSRGFEYLRLETIERERQHREWEIERARAEERRRLEKIEQARREHLLELASNFSKAQEIRKLVEAIRSSYDDSHEIQGLEIWLQWAEAVAADLNPILDRRRIIEQYESIAHSS